MKILITAGGTSEAIDQVRAITNHATGALGLALIEQFLQHPQVSVDYVTTATAYQPSQHERLKIFHVSDTQSVYQCLQELLTKHNYSAVIHTMAISDFAFQAAQTIEALLKKLNTRLTTNQKPFSSEELLTLLAGTTESSNKKISSNTEQLILTLKKTPKIIQQIKHWQPTTCLFGFKLLANVTKEELLNVAKNSLQKNQADYVIANDLAHIDGNKHLAYLINKENQIVQQADNKQAIAQMIYHQWLLNQEGYDE